MITQNELKSIIHDLDKEREILKEKRKKGLPFIFVVGLGFLVGSAVLFNSIKVSLISSLVGLILSFVLYTVFYQYPFNDLKHKLRKAFVAYFMGAFHPDIQYEYIPKDHKGSSIASASNLISFNRSDEEDVIKGIYKNVEFYISELKLKRKSKDNTYTVFKGILFKVRLPNRNFPASTIISQQNIVSKLIGNYKKNQQYNFSYKTSDEHAFHEELAHLFPFISHLDKNEGQICIKTKDDEITILLESDMAFLDSPAPSMVKSFDDPNYFDNASRQINTLLYIVEVFADGIAKNKIEEQLELKSLEVIKKVNQS